MPGVTVWVIVGKQLAKGRVRRRSGKRRKRKLKKVKRNEKRQLWYFSTLKRDASVTLQQGTRVGEMKINSAYSPNEVNSRVG